MKMIRKESLKEKNTSEIFFALQDKIENINKTQKHYNNTIQSILKGFSQEDYIFEKLHELLKEINEAEGIRKWGIIVAFIYQKDSIS